MNRERLYEANDDDDDADEEDDIGEDLEDLRRACMVSEGKSASVGADGGVIPSDSENDDDFEMLQSIKSHLASSTDVDLCGTPPMGLSVPSDSENGDDFEMLRSIRSQLGSSTDVDLGGTPPMGLLVPSDSESEDDLEMLRSIKRQLALPMDEDEDGQFETLRAISRRFSAYENFDLGGNFMNDSPRKKKRVHASDNEPSSKILSISNTCERFPDHGKLAVTVPDSETSFEPLDHLVTCQSSPMPAASSRFPESAQALVDAIRRNRSYQFFLRRKLGEIEATIKQNEKHKKNVMIVKDFQASCKRTTKQALSQRKHPLIELISTQKSGPADSSEGNDKKISPLKLGPPENSCVANYRMALEKYPVSVDRRNWSTMENENLAKGLKQQVQKTLILEAIERSSELEDSADDINSVLEAIKNLEITPEMIRQFLRKVNWEELDIKNRSAAECEARWMSSEDPLINNDPWTVAEDNYIRLITQNRSYTDWLDVAVSLGTNRTPLQCLARYQRSLNAGMLRKEWTPEEDGQLRDAVDLFGEKDWQSVANVLKGRTGTQCSNRWKKSLHPSIEMKGKWSLEEKKRLKVAVTLFGAKNWSKIAQFVPGRSDVQCQGRWKSLDPKVKRGKWSKDEDAKLNEAVKEHGHGNWSKVATHLCGRTRIQCSRRWSSLNPDLVPLKREARRLRREATLGNFVDRESERPDFIAGDFLALAEISIEPEEQPETVPQKKKRKARQKKSVTEKQPKRRKKGLERCSLTQN